MNELLVDLFVKRIESGKLTLQEVLDNPNIADDIKQAVQERLA